MRKLLCLSLLIIITSTVKSQKTDDKTMKKMVNDMCDCVMPLLNKLHPQIIKMFETTNDKGEEAASKEFGDWYTKADQSDIGKVMADLQYIENDFQNEMDDCQKKLDKKYSAEVTNELTNKENKKLIKAIKEKKDCKILAIVIEMGLKAEEDQ